ncbi:hypothetical protein [Streptomyces sp. NPDC029554]
MAGNVRRAAAVGGVLAVAFGGGAGVPAAACDRWAGVRVYA